MVKRPYIKHPIDEENETEYPNRIACLCKWNKDYLKVHYDNEADLLYNQIDKQIRKEAFALMDEYYLDLWD